MLAATGVAIASIPDSANGRIYACSVKTTGALRVIDRAKHQHCTSSERALSWSNGVTFRGSWSASATYRTNDAVTLNGSSYLARIERAQLSAIAHGP
jgi:hypothetical protein